MRPVRPYGRPALAVWLLATVVAATVATASSTQERPSREKLRGTAMLTALAGIPLALYCRRRSQQRG